MIFEKAGINDLTHLVELRTDYLLEDYGSIPDEKLTAIKHNLPEYFRKHLSSVATPVFALDLPEGGGKVHLFPDYSAGEEQLFFGLDGKKIRHPLA